MARQVHNKIPAIVTEKIEFTAELANQDALPPWWEQISGVFQNEPLFDEAMQLGREWRQSEREVYDDEPNSILTGGSRVSSRH